MTMNRPERPQPLPVVNDEGPRTVDGIPSWPDPDGGPKPIEAFGGSGEDSAEAVDISALDGFVVATLKTIYDPEIPVNIHDLGLIYGVDISDTGAVDVRMTLTAPGCPVAGSLVEEVARKVGSIPGVSRSHVSLVWDPPWTQDRMTEEARLELGLL
ncbi:MAG TPA: DUF59 domain-containing protein [Kofleriaceae bacterium]|nr:DUF59 domain-containing protein [Kofleriaceae bacterium]